MVSVFDERTNGQAVVHYSRHRRTASVAYVTTLIYRVGQKMAPFIVRLITSPNINRFSKFLHCQNQETICNETVIIDSNTPQVCRYTTLWYVKWRTQGGDATDDRWSSLACGRQTTQT